MEGFTPTLVLLVVACITLGAAALALFLVVGGLFFSGRPALKLFATAMLCGVASAGLMRLADASTGSHWSLNHLFTLCLILAGIGQFITARRNPERYPASLACAIAASAFALGPLTANEASGTSIFGTDLAWRDFGIRRSRGHETKAIILSRSFR
jgi:hypothetical protein